MVNQRDLPDFRLADGDGCERPFHDFLAKFNILAIRRVPVPSHGPATPLLRYLLEERLGAEGVTVRGFDVRSPDRPCETCRGPHIVYSGPDLATICDGDGSFLRKFGVVGYDRFFVVGSGSQVIDVGSLQEISRSRIKLCLEGAASQDRAPRAPPPHKFSGPRPTVLSRRARSCGASNQMA